MKNPRRAYENGRRARESISLRTLASRCRRWYFLTFGSDSINFPATCSPEVQRIDRLGFASNSISTPRAAGRWRIHRHVADPVTPLRSLQERYPSRFFHFVIFSKPSSSRRPGESAGRGLLHPISRQSELPGVIPWQRNPDQDRDQNQGGESSPPFFIGRKPEVSVL